MNETTNVGLRGVLTKVAATSLGNEPTATSLHEVAIALENSRVARIEQGRAAEADADAGAPRSALLRSAEGLSDPRNADAGDGDVDTNGDLIERERYIVTGWKTQHEDEDGEVYRTDMPSTAGVMVSNLLRRGYYQIIVGDQKGGS